MTSPVRSLRHRFAAIGACLLLTAVIAPTTGALAAQDSEQRYLVVFNGQYALDGSYALGSGYALGSVYALGAEYALDGLYALYALGDQYALDVLNGTYALDGDYALGDGYALGDAYALANGYALYALYALDDAYALLGDYALDGDYALTGDAGGYALYALGDNYALAHEYALSLVEAAGGTVAADLSRQLGVMIVDSKNASFAETMSSYALVATVGQDYGWKQFPTMQEAINNGQLVIVNPASVPSAGGADPLAGQQWNMALMRTAQAQQRQAGNPGVSVGIVDTGIDGNHLDFVANGQSNVDCARGADFTAQGPGIGSPFACVDNNFHGTHVAGIVAARANGLGVTGVAPNVTLVPIKVCDADGHCYASDVVEGITYAGDLALNVINMSFFVDDDEFQQSTEFKCQSDATQRAFRQATERAIAYARKQGVTPIAALGNSNTDIAHHEPGCAVVPAQTSGVVGVSSIGPESGRAYYSNWGSGAADVAAPGGDFLLARDAPSGQTICDREVLSTIPGNLYGCFQGTSMASPHATGVAALIVSQFGKAAASGRITLSPDKVVSLLAGSAVDIGRTGSDECYGSGRIDALRAVLGDTSRLYDPAAPVWAACP
jgi:subtilisin family serine protease